MPGGRRPISGGPGAAGFTLTELLVAITVFLIIVGVVLQFTEQTGRIWRNTTAKIQAFQEARAAFDSATRLLGQATLNTYFDYYDASNKPRSQLTSEADLQAFVPASYDRVSELHFISGQAETLLANAPLVTQTHAVFFQAPRGYSVVCEGLDNALNASGYFLQFDDGSASVPAFIQSSPGFQPRYRFRMMEMSQPTENLGVYFASASSSQRNDWFVQNASAHSRVIAENVIALVFLPKLADREDDPAGLGRGVSLAPAYNYNSRVPLKAASDPDWADFPADQFVAYPTSGSSTSASRHHQLPPLVRMLMVVIDEASAVRLQGNATTVPPAIDFSKTSLFTDATKLEEDIRAVEDICNAKPGNLTGNTVKLAYRVFSTDIIMRQAKWSGQ